MSLYWPLLQSFVSVSLYGSTTGVSPASAPDQGCSDPGYTETVSELYCKCFSKLTLICLFLFFCLCRYQRVFVNLSEKAIKQRQPTTMITIYNCK